MASSGDFHRHWTLKFSLSVRQEFSRFFFVFFFVIQLTPTFLCMTSTSAMSCQVLQSWRTSPDTELRKPCSVSSTWYRASSHSPSNSCENDHSPFNTNIHFHPRTRKHHHRGRATIHARVEWEVVMSTTTTPKITKTGWLTQALRFQPRGLKIMLSQQDRGMGRVEDVCLQSNVILPALLLLQQACLPSVGKVKSHCHRRRLDPPPTFWVLYGRVASTLVNTFFATCLSFWPKQHVRETKVSWQEAGFYLGATKLQRSQPVLNENCLQQVEVQLRVDLYLTRNLKSLAAIYLLTLQAQNGNVHSEQNFSSNMKKHNCNNKRTKHIWSLQFCHWQSLHIQLINWVFNAIDLQ